MLSLGNKQKLIQDLGVHSTFLWSRPWLRICPTGQMKMWIISWYRSFSPGKERCESLAAIRTWRD